MTHADEPSKPRRRRNQSRTIPPATEVVTHGTPPSSASLEEDIERERVQLMQVQAMLKCLYEVLLYADDDDSVMHADVANVAARLLDESVSRLDALRMRLSQPAIVQAAEQKAQGPAAEQKEDFGSVPPPDHQVKEPPAAYLC